MIKDNIKTLHDYNVFSLCDYIMYKIYCKEYKVAIYNWRRLFNWQYIEKINLVSYRQWSRWKKGAIPNTETILKLILRYDLDPDIILYFIEN